VTMVDEEELVPISKQELAKLSSDGLLLATDSSYLTSISEDLIERMDKLQQFRPKYLMEVSVLKDTRFPTPDAKYWQCILERNVHFTNLCFLHFDYMEKLAEIKIKEEYIKELEVGKPTPRTKAIITKIHIQIARMKAQVAFSRKEAKERVREIRAWTELIAKFEPDLKYSKDNPEAHMPKSFLIRFAAEKQMLQEIGASDMSGAMNIIGLGKTAVRYWKEHQEDSDKVEGEV
jgi:hypothetical protein